jgi:glyoxylase-like metal-dependent hydrolase (beta-lactamase superfamily II)
MRVVSLHEDVLVATSQAWQTTCTAVRSGEECFVIDSPVFPDELEALPAVLAQAAFSASGTPTGLLVTHADWDHLLGRLAFPGAAIGSAETTAARLTAEPGDAQRKLRDFDDEHYVTRARPLSLGRVQALPVPGHLAIGEAHELELHPADGHTADGMAVWIPWAGVLVCGDYLSPVEIPMVSEGGSRAAYLATLARLRPLVEQAEHVVPGHGGVLDPPRALALLEEDVAYLHELVLPAGRRSAEQRRIHAENLERIGAR